ncbi:MAG: DUF2279 domain-containing protein [Candidatus Kapaibacterium sp.]
MIKSSFVIFILLIYICTSSLFSKEIENIKKIDSTEFYYANTKRYSLSGELPNLETKINVPYFIGITATTAAFMVSQHIYQSNTIWKDKAEFKIIEDGQYALYADKAGHIFGGYIMSYAYTEFLSSAGISWELSNILGASIGLTYQTYIEVLDGYGSNFGFSPSDFYADIFGASFFLAQHYVPFLQNFTPKFMYIPADAHGERKRRPHFAFIDDYSSHTMWMSVNVHNILGEEYNQYWPKWLQLSFGYAVRNLCDPNDPNFDCTDSYAVNGIVHGDRKFIIALDYNLAELIPEVGAPFDWFVQSLNYVKFPSPAIEFGEETKFMLVYPFVEF